MPGGDARSEGQGRGEEDLRLGQEHQPQGQARRHQPPRAAMAQKEHPRPENGERQHGAVGDLVGIGADVVVVADAQILGEGEDGDEDQAGGGGGEPAGHGREHRVEHRGERRHQQQVEDGERQQTHPPELHHAGVQVRRKRAVEVGDVAVEHLALGQPPGHVELLAVVHDRVGPLAPAAGGEDRRREQDRKRRRPRRESGVSSHTEALPYLRRRRRWPRRALTFRLARPALAAGLTCRAIRRCARRGDPVACAYWEHSKELDGRRRPA